MLPTGLAARWRPRRFCDVAGQGPASNVLHAAASSAQPVQQILLSGPSGTGKTTLARIYAATLLCADSDPAARPCNNCPECEAVFAGSHPDVHELDAASHGGVDEVRKLSDIAHHSSSRGSWRIFIIDEAHGLTSNGAQAFLKLLEEPPAHAIFCLATTDPHKLPIAIRGRCLNVPVQPVDLSSEAENLIRVAALAGWTITDDVAAVIARATNPQLGVRGTLMTLEKTMPLLKQNPDIGPAEIARYLGVVDNDTINDLVDAAIEGDTHFTTRTITTIVGAALPDTLLSQISDHCLEIVRHSTDEERCARAGELLGYLPRKDPTGADIVHAVVTASASFWLRDNPAGITEDSVLAAFTAGQRSVLGPDAGGPRDNDASAGGEPDSSTAEVVREDGKQPGPVDDVVSSGTSGQSFGVNTDEVTLNDLLNAVSAVNARAALNLRKCGAVLHDTTLTAAGLDDSYRPVVENACREFGVKVIYTGS